MKSLRRSLPLFALAAVTAAPARAAGAGLHVRSLAARATLCPVELRLPARASLPFTVRDRASEVGIEVAATGLLDVEGSRMAGRVSFKAVTASGARLALALRPDGIEDTFTLPQPVAPRIVYDVTLSHVAGLRLVENSLELLDADGTPRLRMSPPVVIGADGTRTPASVSVTGCAVDTNPAAPWGRTPTPPGSTRCAVIVRWPESVRYPLTVDPAWTSTGSMMEAREGHGMSLLANGRVLVTGGRQWNGGSWSDLNDAEIYDPATGTWATTGQTQNAYFGPIQVSLDDGSVLVVGSSGAAEVYNPSTGAWWTTAPIPTPSIGASGVKLADGTVLVTGGCQYNSGHTACPVVLAAQRYLPKARKWQAAGQLPEGRISHAASLLPDGRVLVTGGYNPYYFQNGPQPEPTEIYDPTGNSWSTGPSLPLARWQHSAVALEDGRIVVAGGTNEGMNTTGVYAGAPSVDVFDPVPGSWKELKATGRSSPAVTAVGGHYVAMLGGLSAKDNLAAVVSQLLDVDASTWSPLDSPGGNRLYAAAIALKDGRALVSGGLVGNATVASAEVLAAAPAGPGDAGADAAAGGDSGTPLTCGAGTVQQNGRCVAAPGANKSSGCGCRAAGHHGRESGGELLLFAIAFGLCARRRRR